MSEIANVIPFDIREYGHPPIASKENPFIQVNWIFERRAARVQSRSGRNNYMAALAFYKKYLLATHGRQPYEIKEHWDEYALLRLKGYLENTETGLSSYTLVGHLSSIRQVMKEAVSYGLLSCKQIHDVASQSAFRETDAHLSYSDAELDQILEAISAEMRYTYSVISGYKPQSPNKGRDPRETPQRTAKQGFGWKVEDNARWYFEHEMGARALSSNGEAKLHHKSFFAAATNLHGGLHNLYRRWGVAAYIDEFLVMPMVINLLYLTGLNPSSLLGLKIDSFREEHPLTGMPYLLFEKERSGGEKELHLPLLDSRDERALKRKQSLQVRKVIQNQLALSARLRHQLPKEDEISNNLFIYQSCGQRTLGEVRILGPDQTSAWCKAMVKKYNLRSDSGKPLVFNLVRFRSTKLTEMALEGRDFFEIQQIARHKSVRTTVGYIAKNRLDPVARETISKALEQIRANRSEPALTVFTTEINPQPVKLFRGLIADCKNVFDPPERIKKSIQYSPGQACTRFNMCLFCKNVVVMREHLPVLAAYRAQLLTARANNIQNLPHAELYDRTLELLDNLFDIELGEFSEEDVAWATEMAVGLDIIVDPLLYQGVLA